eukprot:3249585-Ditylum_brightwellii.AAC.1
MKASFESMTDDEFFKFQTMEDSDALLAMSFIGELLIIGMFINQDIVICLVTQMIELSLSHGLCKES